VHDKEGVEWGKGLGVGHREHTIRTYLCARDGDAWDVRTFRREDDVVDVGMRDTASEMGCFRDGLDCTARMWGTAGGDVGG
jgi:hypothetical protein